MIWWKYNGKKELLNVYINVERYNINVITLEGNVCVGGTLFPLNSLMDSQDVQNIYGITLFILVEFSVFEKIKSTYRFWQHQATIRSTSTT